MGKRIPIWQILIVFAVLIGGLMFTILKVEGYIHIPLVLGGVFAAFIAVANGYKWSYLEKGVVKNIGNAMQALLILFTVGMLIGTWIAGGIVPSMIYYGLMILSPGVFLVATTLICCIVSLATGSSWTTAGTVGIALIGIGSGLGISLGMTAGAIISGAYFGDKMSPLSDSTNLAPAMAEVPLFDHIKHMVYTVTPSLIISLIIFGILGINHSNNNADMSGVTELMTGMSDNFYISPILLLPAAFIIMMVIFKVPALPGLFAGVVLGIICAVAFQGGDWAALTGIGLYEGYVSETGIEFIDNLLTRGGLSSMFYSVSLVICAMVLAGILDASDMLKIVCEKLLKIAKNTGSLVAVVIITCIGCNVLAADQYIAIVLPGRMYKEVFEDRRLKRKNLSRILEDAGTVTSALVPWSTCGTYMSSTLGVATLTYLPYCFLNMLNPLISLFYGITGITMEKMSEEEYQAILIKREADAEAAMKTME